MANQETKVVCPVCGAEFAIPAHEAVVAGVAIGQDSNLGTIELPLANHQPHKLSAEAKIQALKQAGVDVSNLLSLRGSEDTGQLFRIKDGALESVANDDPIFKAIIKSGTIPNRRLFRRWVMSQVFHMLIAKGGFTEALKHKGFPYQWQMVIEEFRVQAKLEVTDPEAFAERNRWFNKEVLRQMCLGYIEDVNKYIENARIKKCRGRKYVHFKRRNVFKDEIQEKVFKPMFDIVDVINDAQNSATLYEAAKNFYQEILKTLEKWNMKQNAKFIDAYKGAGAYFTMKNLILFHGCKMVTDDGEQMSQIGSMKKLNSKANEYANEGWRLFGVMKKLIADNNIDIAAKIASWRK